MLPHVPGLLVAQLYDDGKDCYDGRKERDRDA